MSPNPDKQDTCVTKVVSAQPRQAGCVRSQNYFYVLKPEKMISNLLNMDVPLIRKGNTVSVQMQINDKILIIKSMPQNELGGQRKGRFEEGWGKQDASGTDSTPAAGRALDYCCKLCGQRADMPVIGPAAATQNLKAESKGKLVFLAKSLDNHIGLIKPGKFHIPRLDGHDIIQRNHHLTQFAGNDADVDDNDFKISRSIVLQQRRSQH